MPFSNTDPTLLEMRTMLDALRPEPYDEHEFDRECAIYWFASDWHSGSRSNLYSALSQSRYHPGVNERGPEPHTPASAYYDALREAYVYDNGGVEPDEEEGA